MYWYGTPRDDLRSAFSFIKQCDIVSYKHGIEMGFNKIPDAVNNKIDSGKALTKDQKLLCNGLQEQCTELKLLKEKRVAWIKIIEENMDKVHQRINEESKKRKIVTDDYIVMKPKVANCDGVTRVTEQTKKGKTRNS